MEDVVDGTKEVVRYVEVPIVEEVIKHIPKKQVVEIERRVPKIETEFVERIVEVPQIRVIEKQVELPQIQEVVKHVPKVEIQEVETEVIKYKPVCQTKIIEKIVEVPGEVKKVLKPYDVVNEVCVSRYIDEKQPVVVAQTIQPVVTSSKEDSIDVVLKEFAPYIVPVDIFVPKPVERKMVRWGSCDANSPVTVSDSKFNSLLQVNNSMQMHGLWKTIYLKRCVQEANPKFHESKFELPYKRNPDSSFSVVESKIPSRSSFDWKVDNYQNTKMFGDEEWTGKRDVGWGNSSGGKSLTALTTMSSFATGGGRSFSNSSLVNSNAASRLVHLTNAPRRDSETNVPNFGGVCNTKRSSTYSRWLDGAGVEEDVDGRRGSVGVPSCSPIVFNSRGFSFGVESERHGRATFRNLKKHN